MKLNNNNYCNTDNNTSIKSERENTLICFSHLRWDFVYQRPQHLMSRFATTMDVLYVEEPVYSDDPKAILSIRVAQANVLILLPIIPKGLSKDHENLTLGNLIKEFIFDNNYDINIKWYYTPMMFQWSKDISSSVTIYDCMDELSAFKNAPKELKQCESDLIDSVDLLYTGGASLYEAKCSYHPSVHLFPSSVDSAHFLKARDKLPIPFDQEGISSPKIGFYGVIDERFDIELLKNLATLKPEWNFIIIGPIVKISFDDLPKSPNIHYLGAKTYEELPSYLSSWDVALIPFAINESTRFISPTKTPEYLAAGKAVVSTPIKDIVNTYKDSDIVHIASSTNLPAFIDAIKAGLSDSLSPEKLYKKADVILKNMCWNKTFLDMHELIIATQNMKEVV